MNRVVKLLLFAVALTVIGAGLAAYYFLGSPSSAAYASLGADGGAPEGSSLRARFLGVSTILLDDGETAILTDGFFSRPGLVEVLLRRIEPDEPKIDAALARAGITRLAAVMTAHSHYDHAMDAPLVANKTGAVLIGSASTANIARGLQFPEDRMRVIEGGETFSFGRFKVTAIKSLHTPGGMFMGDIEEAVTPPVRAGDYREGGTYSYLIEHDGRRSLIHASTNFIPGFLENVKADSVFLGIALLGRQDEAFIDAYWREVVEATGAKLVIPIHWDNFFRPLSKPLEPLPRLVDDFERGMDAVIARAQASGVSVRFPPSFEPIAPFPAAR